MRSGSGAVSGAEQLDRRRDSVTGRLRRLALLLGLGIASCQSEGDLTANDAGSTSAAGPQPGAPDELCDPNPDRVYLVEHPFEGIPSVLLTDLDDPSAVCAYRETFRENIRLDPVRGGLITLHGDQVWRLEHDWLAPRSPGSDIWVPDPGGEDNDEQLGRVMRSPEITCRVDDPYVLLTDDATVYASCGGAWFNAAEIDGVGDWPNLVGLVNGRKIFKAPPFTMFGYFTEDPEQVPLVPIGMPGDVDAIEHLAVRPVAGALLAAVQVWRGDVVTTEQARIDANGITLAGTYAHDVGEAGVPFMDYALAADGTVYGIEIVSEDGAGTSGRRVVRMTLSDRPLVIMTAPSHGDDRPTRLVAVGAGGPTPSRL